MTVRDEENQESITLSPVYMHMEISDDSKETRGTFGELWFSNRFKRQLKELRDLREAIKSVKVIIHRRTYHFENMIFDSRFSFEGKKYLKIKFASSDLVSVKDY